jgi:hypothetical protein
VPTGIQGNPKPAPTTRPPRTGSTVRSPRKIPNSHRPAVSRPTAAFPSHNAARINRVIREGRNRAKSIASQTIMHQAAAIMGARSGKIGTTNRAGTLTPPHHM